MEFTSFFNNHGNNFKISGDPVAARDELKKRHP